jgi:hypothetical protein
LGAAARVCQESHVEGGASDNLIIGEDKRMARRLFLPAGDEVAVPAVGQS